MFSFPTGFAFRKCNSKGQWDGGPSGSSSTVGWTNYTMCYSPEMADLMNKLNHKEGQVGWALGGKAANSNRPL